MGKFRTKLKGQTKGRRWRKGQSSSSNPSITKHRDLAKGRFFHENLGGSSLTTDALKKHNAIHIFGHGLGDTKKSPAESEISIARSLQDISICDDDATGDGSESGVASFKTFQTFASDWSACSNVSFTRLFKKFDSNCALHKEMLAILAAVTDIIKEKGGSETSTEYYAALMETLKAAEGDEGVAATISLLSMGIKSVSPAVLRKQFSEASEVFVDLLERYAESENNVILRYVIGCLSVFLRAQDYATWNDSSTMKVFESLLAFVIHSKPKVRKAAQHAICAIIRASCFMLPSEDPEAKIIKLHPASNRVATMCIRQMKAEVLLSSQTTVLHILTLLNEAIPFLSKEYIKSCCESILSLMTQNDIIVKTWCLKVLNSLFQNSTESTQLTSKVTIQLIRALTAYRPSAVDTRQTLAWMVVMQNAFICLSKSDLDTCMSSLPTFVQVCVSELWLSDKTEITSATSNALKAILQDCVKIACETEDIAKKYWSNLESVFKIIKTGLDNPFNQSTRQVILTISVCFEIGSKHVEPLLAPILIHLNERKESPNFILHKELEYATGCATKSLGPQFVLHCIPLKNSSSTINLDRSWLLPVFKEKIQNSTLLYFSSDILSLATLCRNQSKSAASSGDQVNAHTYELMCGQLWSLLPNFCNNPSDVKDNFKNIARILGTVLKDNPDFRPSVMQGLRKLINTRRDNEDEINEIARFAKNFIPLLLNIYMTPIKGSSAEGQHLAALETIQVYLSIAPESLREELFNNSLTKLENTEDYFVKESLLDVVRILILYQNEEKIKDLFVQWILPLCENTGEEIKKSIKKSNKIKNNEITNEEKSEKQKLKEQVKMIDMEHKKAYRILEEIFKSENENCKAFLNTNKKIIQKMLMQSLNKAADSSKATRLRCIQHLIKSQPNLDYESKLIKSALPEAVICTRDINSKCRQCAYDLITVIGETLQNKTNGLDHFTAMLEAGLQGTPNIITATIWCLASATYNFSAALGLPNLQRIMENICQLIKTADRQVVGACVSFLKVYTKSLPSPIVAGSLPIIFNSIAEMCEDCKRHTRTELGNLLTRLMRKYGAGTIGQLIPETDEGMQKKLRHSRKMDSRKKRQKELRKSQKMEGDSDDEIQLKGASKTLEEILKDSDSELEMDMQDNQREYKSNKKLNQTWIREDADNIIDLMDPSAAKNITATRPDKKSSEAQDSNNLKKKKKEIKTTPDGKLILNFDDSDSDEDDNDKRKSKFSDDSENSEDDMSASETMLFTKGKKRKYDDTQSKKSGRSNKSDASSKWSQPQSKYRPGGKGIHRNMAASVPGSEYKMKKAKGDMKKKGKPDPYAYVPLARSTLNKRKRTKNDGQFKNIMKGAKKGAIAGRISKAKLRVKNKK